MLPACQNEQNNKLTVSCTVNFSSYAYCLEDQTIFYNGICTSYICVIFMYMYFLHSLTRPLAWERGLTRLEIGFQAASESFGCGLKLHTTLWEMTAATTIHSCVISSRSQVIRTQPHQPRAYLRLVSTRRSYRAHYAMYVHTPQCKSYAHELTNTPTHENDRDTRMSLVPADVDCRQGCQTSGNCRNSGFCIIWWKNLRPSAFWGRKIKVKSGNILRVSLALPP